MNDVDFPVAARARRNRRSGRGRAAREGEHASIKRGVNEQLDSRDGRALPRHRPHAAVHRVHGRRRTRTAGASTTSCRRPRSSSASRPSSRSSPSTRAYRGEVAQAVALRGRRRRSRRDLVGHQPFCGDCTVRASRRRAASTPVSSASAARPARADSRRARPTRSSRRRGAPGSGQAHRPLLRAAARRDRLAAEGGDELHRRLRTHRQDGLLLDDRATALHPRRRVGRRRTEKGVATIGLRAGQALGSYASRRRAPVSSCPRSRSCVRSRPCSRLPEGDHGPLPDRLRRDRDLELRQADWRPAAAPARRSLGARRPWYHARRGGGP